MEQVKKGAVMDSEIIMKVKGMVVKYINPKMSADEIAADKDMILYGMNSLSFIRLIVAVEKEFAVEFDESIDVSQARTVNKIAEYIEANI